MVYSAPLPLSKVHKRKKWAVQVQCEVVELPVTLNTLMIYAIKKKGMACQRQQQQQQSSVIPSAKYFSVS